MATACYRASLLLMRKSSTASPKVPEPQWVPELRNIEDLHLDPRNPRLVDVDLGPHPTDDQILKALWQGMAVDEVAFSIAQNGFYRHEPLYAAREDGKLYVIEGNRRLAAVRLLRDENLRQRIGAMGLPTLSSEERDKLERLPVILCQRDDPKVWAFLGFKHINGPQAWESYPKAQYIAWVRNTLNVSLEQIAERIGDVHSTVARLYDALMVLEQAETAGVFNRSDRYKNHFSFSHLMTGLGYPGIRKFLGLPPGEKTLGKKHPVSKKHEKKLGELLIWMFGAKSESREPIIQSQNPDLRRLDETLANERGVIALRKGLPLAVSLEISLGDERVFREALVTAKANLQKARGTVLSGFHGTADLVRTAKEIEKLAIALVRDMETNGVQPPAQARRNKRN